MKFLVVNHYANANHFNQPYAENPSCLTSTPS